MWAIVLGNALFNPRIKKRRFFGTFARTLALLWIILWLVVRNAYQGALYKYLQGNWFTSNFDTVEKVRKSDCNIITTPPIYNVMNHLMRKNR